MQNNDQDDLISIMCPICHEEYSKPNHDPVHLRCGHDLCRSCLQGIYTRDGSTFLCPLCRTEHDGTLPRRMSTNFTLLDSAQRSRASSTNSNENYSNNLQYRMSTNNSYGNLLIDYPYQMSPKSTLLDNVQISRTSSTNSFGNSSNDLRRQASTNSMLMQNGQRSRASSTNSNGNSTNNLASFYIGELPKSFPIAIPQRHGAQISYLGSDSSDMSSFHGSVSFNEAPNNTQGSQSFIWPHHRTLSTCQCHSRSPHSSSIASKGSFQDMPEFLTAYIPSAPSLDITNPVNKVEHDNDQKRLKTYNETSECKPSSHENHKHHSSVSNAQNKEFPKNTKKNKSKSKGVVDKLISAIGHILD